MKILITGITGTLGTAMARYINKHRPLWEIIGISRDEQKQSSFPTDIRAKLILCDIRDRERVMMLPDADIVLHFAALKCIDVVEANPYQGVLTNVIGTQNIIDYSTERSSKIVFTSTDKAVEPINSYGFQKALAECLVLQNPNNSVCRYGNVLGSRGSVLHKFADTLKKHQMAYITDFNMTRFWMHKDDAVKLVFDSILKKGLCLPNLKSAPILELVDAVASVVCSTYAVDEIGIRAGEKIHESITPGVTSEKMTFTEEELKILVKKSLGLK